MLPLHSEDVKVRPDATTLLSTHPDSGDDSDRKPPTEEHVRIKMKMEVYDPTLEFLQRDRFKEEDYKKLDKMKNVCSFLYISFLVFQFSYIFIYKI